MNIILIKGIWIFNHYAITPDLSGGTRHFDFAKELLKRGYKVTIFASSFHYSLLEEMKEYNNKNYIEEEYNGVKFVWIKTFPYSQNNWRRVLNMMSYSIRAYKIGKLSHLEKPDIIIGSSVHPFAGITAYFLSRHYKVPFVFEVRDLWPQTLIDLGDISPYHPFIILLRWIERFLYERAIKIITLLPKAEDYITSLGIEKEKIVWISNGVDLSRIPILESNQNKDKFIIMYLGFHGPGDALESLLDSAKIIQDKGYKNIYFKLIGDGPKKEDLIKKAKVYNLDNVFFLNPVKKNEVGKVLSGANILYVGQLRKELYKYGISFNKLFDYLASGKPIVFSSNASNNPIEEAKAGITVPPENPEAIADAIIKLYNMDEEERRKMGENGRKYVEKYYSIPVLVDKLEKTVKEAIELYERSKT